MAKEALTATKALYDAISQLQSEGGHELDLDAVKRVVKQANAAIHQVMRESAMVKVRARAEQDTLRAEIHSELIDVAANAARVADRQRALFERHQALSGQLSAHDRAAASASYVEAALAALCPNGHTRSSGCDQLAAL